MNNIFLNAFLLTYAALFPVVNPVGSAPIFLSMTRDRSQEQRAALARAVARNSFLLLLGSVLLGSHILQFFGISLPVLRIAGGLTLAAFGWNTLNSGASQDHKDATDATHNDSFYPLTMPLTIGPGCISVAITLGSQRPETAEIMQLLLLALAMALSLLAIIATVYLCYRFADKVVQMLGVNGAIVVIRLSAFILLCIGIQFIWNGWSGLHTGQVAVAAKTAIG